MVKCTGGGKERDCRDEYLNLFMVQIDKLTFVVTCFSRIKIDSDIFLVRDPTTVELVPEHRVLTVV